MTSPDAPKHQEPLDDPEKHLPASHNPLPELIEVGPQKGPISEEAYMAAQNSAEFANLKKAFRSFAFPMTAAFLIWYFAYVLASMFAKDFMATPAIGNLNIGTVLGLGQFVTTFLITWLYIRHMNNRIDPIATKLRTGLEESAR